MKQISLIANSGIQFFSETITIDPSASPEKNEKPIPQLRFTERQSMQDINKNILQIAYQHDGFAYSLSELREAGCIKKRIQISGEEDDVIDDAGVPVPDWDIVSPHAVESVDSAKCYTEYNFEGGFQLMNPDTGEMQSPLEKVLGQWLPAPLFYAASDGQSICASPSKWCRVRITELEKGKKGNQYRLEWAFDTTLLLEEQLENSGLENSERPYFYSNEPRKSFTLPTRVSHFLSFFENNEWASDYLASIIFGDNVQPKCDLPGKQIARCRHMAYYISLFTNLYVVGAFPVVTLYNDSLKDSIPVDLVLDIGNSRTCGLLVEKEDFSKAQLLGLRDLTHPYKFHEGSFDMRLAFRKTEFGIGNMGIETFQWRSFLRIGEEAKFLISNSERPNNLSKVMTHHSSPKRYLWDNECFKDQWQFLQMEDIDTMIQENGVYIDGLSQQLNADGSFHRPEDTDSDSSTRYSRRSLMTFVFVEIIQQAITQINSHGYVSALGEVDCKREINNVIVTCPTAMPEEEQKALRQCAVDAMVMLRRSLDLNSLYGDYDPQLWEPFVNVVPRPEHIGSAQPGQAPIDWSYDEATCCQLVYLYAEVVEKYNGNCDKFISSIGHIREDLKASGYERKSLTVASVDIGAGTTDLMISAYKYNQYAGGAELTPFPLFWDSFYVAGDDILNEIVRRLVLHNPSQTDYREGYGPLSSTLAASMLAKTSGVVDDDVKSRIANRAYERVVGFFSGDDNNGTIDDHRMRNDFNIQISVPVAQKMLDMMKNGEDAQDLTYEQIFTTTPPSRALLAYIKERFDLDICELKWVYSPEAVSDCIRTKMEKLLKQLSIIIDAFNCDVVLLAGRPMSLEAVTDLFLKYFPVAPNRLVRMLPKNENAKSIQQMHNCYKVGRWFPSHDDVGYFRDLKPVVATGAYVGYLASNHRIPQMQLNMAEMKKRMVSTANFMGSYNPTLNVLRREDLSLTPTNSSATLEARFLPHYIVTKQINTEYYEARPIFSLSLKPNIVIPSDVNLNKVSFIITRAYKLNKETLSLQSAKDANNTDITELLQLKEQSLIMSGDQNEYWLDNGAFDF